MTDTKHTPILDVDIFTDLYVAGLAALAQRGDINFPAVMSDIHDGTAHKFSAHIVKCVNMHDELVEALKFYADETLWNNGRFEAGLSEDGGHNVLTMIPGDVHNDHGKIAREALKKSGAL